MKQEIKWYNWLAVVVIVLMILSTCSQMPQ